MRFLPIIGLAVLFSLGFTASAGTSGWQQISRACVRTTTTVFSTVTSTIHDTTTVFSTITGPTTTVTSTVTTTTPAGCVVDPATETAPGCTLLRQDTGDQTDPTAGLWGSIDCVDPTRVQQLTENGNSFRRLTVQDGDNLFGERCEIGRNEMRNGENQPGQTSGTFVLYPEGSHKITFYSERYGAGFRSDVQAWQTVMQMKQAQPYAANGPVDGAPAIELQIHSGLLHLYSFWQEIWTAPAPPLNTWIRYAVDATYSQDPAKGRIQVFADLNGDGDFLDAGEVSPVFTMRTLAYVTQQGGNPPGPAVGQSIPGHLRLGVYHNDTAYLGATVDVDNVQVLG